MPRFLRIANPGAGPRTIARKIGERWIRRGQARWLDAETIERIEATGRLAVIISGARLAEIEYDQAARTGCATVRELRGLPMVGPVVERLLIRRRRAA